MTIELLERPAEASAPPAGMISIAQQIWEEKYRFAPAGGSREACIEKSWTRVARAAASAEKTAALRKRWQRRFYDAQAAFKFLPGGRILAGACRQNAPTKTKPRNKGGVAQLELFLETAA